MSRRAPGYRRLRELLSERDRAIVKQVADLRLMGARQIEAIHFPVGEHESAAAAARARQRVLERLVTYGLLSRLGRRIGGVRAGSASFIYALGPTGQRVIAPDGRRRRFHEPTERFVDHTLAVAQLIVDVTVADRAGEIELMVCQAEPRSWREYGGLAGRQLLRPDAFVALGAGDFEHRWFIEVDRASESLPVVLRKCRQYVAYYQTGTEQAAHDVFPRVCWLVPHTRRADALRKAIAAQRDLPSGLLAVALSDDAVPALVGGER